MQVEHVARIRLASRRTVEQQGKGAVRYCVLGQVIINNQHILALMHKDIQPIEQPGIRRDVLQRRGLGRGRRYDAGIIHRTVLRQRLRHLRDGRALLADRHIDTDNARALLVDDGIQADRSLAGLPVADDQLTLAPSDRDHGVDRLDAGLQRHINGRAFNDARRRAFNGTRLRGMDRTLAVDRLAQCVDNAAEHAPRPPVPRRCRLVRLTVSPSRIFWSEPRITAPTRSSSRFCAMPYTPPWKFEQFAGHAVFQTVYVRDAVADRDNRTDIGQFDLALIVRDLLFNNIAYLFGA